MGKYKVQGSYDSATGVLQLVLTPVSALASIPILNIVLLILIIIYWKSILTFLAALLAFSLIFAFIKFYNDDMDGDDKPWKTRLLVYAIIIGSIGAPFGWLMNKLHGEPDAKPKTEETAGTPSTETNSNNSYAITPYASDTATTTESDQADTLLDGARMEGWLPDDTVGSAPNVTPSELQEEAPAEEVITHSGSPEYVPEQPNQTQDAQNQKAIEPTTTTVVGKTITRIITPEAKLDYRFYLALLVFILGVGTVLWTTLGSFFKKKEPKPTPAKEAQLSKISAPQASAPHASATQPTPAAPAAPKTQSTPTTTPKGETRIYQHKTNGFCEMEFQPTLSPAQIATLQTKLLPFREHSLLVGNGRYKTVKIKVQDTGNRIVNIAFSDLPKVKGIAKEMGYSVGSKIHKI
jgi:hypothetical protein